MKKFNLIIIIAFVGIFISCNPVKGVIENPIGNQRKFLEIKLTPEGISSPVINGKKVPYITEDELVGSVVRWETGGLPVIITPSAAVDFQSTHEDGGIVRTVDVTGDNPIEITNQAGWIVREAPYTNGKKYPDYFLVEIQEENQTICKKFILNSTKTRYQEAVVVENGKTVKTDAGYKYLDPCSQTLFYTNNPRVYLDDGFILYVRSDNRELQITNGHKIPNQN